MSNNECTEYTIENYNGFEQHKFILNSHEAYIIFPKKPREDKRWIWRAEFLGAFDTVDIEMLNRGYYLVYFKICDMYGSPESVELMKGFYDYLVNHKKLYKKTIFFGFSRGALYSVNFTVKYPLLVSALYLDAPVLDIKSWPCGLMNGEGAEKESIECLQIYGLNQTTVKSFKGNPIDMAEVLVCHKIPIAVVAGDRDTAVPHTENCEKLIKIYRYHKVKNLYILKTDCGHHPHSLSDGVVIADFIESN